MNLGILLWNTCNAACAHCAVNSGPKEKAIMTDGEIFNLIDSAFYDCSSPSIGFSGGEAFLYYDRLCRILRYATAKGALVAVNTNGFWGKNYDDACDKIRELNEIGVKKLVVSIDEFHEKFIPTQFPINVIKACKSLHLEVELQFVSTKSSLRLSDLLNSHGDDLLNISCREIPCHPVGRAGAIPKDHLFLNKKAPDGLCPSAIMSVSADGRLIPCCNTAGHSPELELGLVGDDIPKINEKFQSDSLFAILRKRGPKAFYNIAVSKELIDENNNHIDQCHLCHSLFKAEGSRTILTEYADSLMEDVVVEELLHRVTRDISNQAILNSHVEPLS